MNGYPTRIDSCYSCRRNDNVLFTGFFTKSLRKVVFPVPAFPVKKTLLAVCSSNSTSASNGYKFSSKLIDKKENLKVTIKKTPFFKRVSVLRNIKDAPSF